LKSDFSLRDPTKSRVRNSAAKIIDRALSEGRTSLLETEAEGIARSFGINVARSALARNVDEAVQFSKRIGLPVVMKIVSPDILHKSDIGGVVPNVETLAEVRSAYADITRNAKKSNRKARIDGILIQKMAPKTSEFVVGAVRDPQFGPTLMFGLGGIYVELFKDVSFRLAPISKAEAIKMMAETKSSKLLTGFRGSKPLDQDSAASAIVAVGEMMSKLRSIESIDINPLLVYPKGSTAVDVRIIVAKPSKTTSDKIY
jgi:acetate---CoA ligase (ADP-forming) subunit beta